ncbi:tetratricopeptide repeat protein [Streptomyces galilaeus]
MQGRAGDAAGAAQAYADLLKHTVRVLGEDHPDTLTTRSNLAAWRGEAGDAAGAAQAYADLLADRIRVLGEDHPDTLTTRNNLAYWQKAAAKAPTGLGNDHA